MLSWFRERRMLRSFTPREHDIYDLANGKGGQKNTVLALETDTIYALDLMSGGAVLLPPFGELAEDDVLVITSEEGLALQNKCERFGRTLSFVTASRASELTETVKKLQEYFLNELS